MATAHAGPGVTAIGPVRRTFFPRLAGYGAPGHVALTFDDGPDPVTTPLFLAELAARGLHATFFLLGSQVRRHPKLTAEIAAAGHELGVHGWQHRYLCTRTPAATFTDLASARDAVEDAGGVGAGSFRPPYGVLTTAALTAARRLQLRPVLWTCWGREWARGATTQTVLATLRAGLEPGATVLLHDSDAVNPGIARQGLNVLPLLLDECEARGLAVGPVRDHGLS